MLRQAISWQCCLSMFLKQNRRKKNGRVFTYFSIVENKRCSGGKTVQRQVLYLGELNGSQIETWRKSIEVFDADENLQTALSLYPESSRIARPRANRSRHHYRDQIERPLVA